VVGRETECQRDTAANLKDGFITNAPTGPSKSPVSASSLAIECWKSTAAVLAVGILGAGVACYEATRRPPPRGVSHPIVHAPLAVAPPCLARRMPIWRVPRHPPAVLQFADLLPALALAAGSGIAQAERPAAAVGVGGAGKSIRNPPACLGAASARALARHARLVPAALAASRNGVVPRVAPAKAAGCDGAPAPVFAVRIFGAGVAGGQPAGSPTPLGPPEPRVSTIAAQAPAALARRVAVGCDGGDPRAVLQHGNLRLAPPFTPGREVSKAEAALTVVVLGALGLVGHLPRHQVATHPAETPRRFA
jgi:hypothetical protein